MRTVAVVENLIAVAMKTTSSEYCLFWEKLNISVYTNVVSISAGYVDKAMHGSK